MDLMHDKNKHEITCTESQSRVKVRTNNKNNQGNVGLVPEDLPEILSWI